MTPDRTTIDIARGVLLGTFVGDALGARWEGEEAVDMNEAGRRLDTSLSARLYRYTDDTQLTLALAEHLCDKPRVDPAALAVTFRRHFEGHRGYARGMFGIVAAWDRGLAPEEAATSVFPDGSFGNGAAMRAAPVGVIWRDDTDERTAAAHRQAAITHAHPIGKDAAAAQAHAVGLAANQGRFSYEDVYELGKGAQTAELMRTLSVAAQMAARWTIDRRPGFPEIAAQIGTGVLADQSVPAALWVAAVADTIEEALVLALALGGDVDTIAAMACAVTGAALGDGAIPAAWLERLEDGARGYRYALDLANRLAAAADSLGP